MTLDPRIARLIQRGALFVCDHSGGKDSQAMYLKLSKIIPANQLIVIHAELPGVEWEGSVEFIKSTIGDTPLLIAQATKTFIEMVERRGMFPSPSTRQCTSDLKRDPINRELRHYLKAHPEFGGLIVNCMGMRAQESPGRAKQKDFRVNERESKAGREWYDWLPIHEVLETEVFAAIADAGQEPFWTYGAGMKRKSCCFCIMACESDLTLAAKLQPAMYAELVALEKRIGFTMSMSRKPLEQITGIAA
jgi:3''-phosphoadenosine 5''-phosphosulfate sulfotransferase (PAPS reductase)/FAD synthetase and related enzymes